MEQATEPTTTAASPEVRDAAPQGPTLTEAHALVGRIIAELTTHPRDIDMKREISGEYSVHIFWSDDVSGVRALAAWANCTWDLVPSEFNAGTYAETRPVIDGVEVWAWTLLNGDEAAKAEHLLAADRAAPPADASAQPVPAPVPLAESAVAHDRPGLSGGDPLAYGPTGIRCGCGKNAHSNLVPCQPDAEPSAPDTVSFAPAVPHAGGDR
jgi:hypothetical protein